MESLFPRLSGQAGVTIRTQTTTPRLSALTDSDGPLPRFQSTGGVPDITVDFHDRVDRAAAQHYRAIKKQEAGELEPSEDELVEMWNALGEGPRNYAESMMLPISMMGEDFEDLPRDVQESLVAVGRGYSDELGEALNRPLDIER